MRTLTLCLTAGIILTAPIPAFAQQKAQPQQNIIKHTKESAQQYGLIGELPNGLVGAVTGAYKDAYLEELITSINQGRMIIYKAAAKKKRLPIEYVQAKAADQFYKAVGPGHYYYKNGGWQKK
jgi:uncharacterized protein YdbL (DUF1318 family)